MVARFVTGCCVEDTLLRPVLLTTVGEPSRLALPISFLLETRSTVLPPLPETVPPPPAPERTTLS